MLSSGVSRLFLDTAPVIYFVERNPQFVDLVDPIFDRLEADITAVVSAITRCKLILGTPLQTSLRFGERL
ncbi:hypothetical protein [Nostoc linckia]|nr:hypothetical protein [Nostoc linckia]